MINQIALNQFVNTVNNCCPHEVEVVSRADSEKANTLRIQQQTAVINREVVHGDQSGDAPPFWQMNYTSRLNII
jgi:hypothetical protein